MAKSLSPHDYPKTFSTILLALDEEADAMTVGLDIPVDSKTQANNIRREFYSYKRALDTAITTHTSRYSESDLATFRRCRTALQNFMISVQDQPDGTALLRFIARDNTPSGLALRKGMEHAIHHKLGGGTEEVYVPDLASRALGVTPASPTIDMEDLPPEEQDDILKRWEEGRRKLAMIESGELPDPLAHIPKKT